MVRLILSCLGGKVKFHSKQWNGYRIKLEHDPDNMRRYFPFKLIPYFWDNELTFDMGVKISKNKGEVNEKWGYEWELRDLDENVIKQGNNVKQGTGTIQVTNKGFRRKYVNEWNTLEQRAIVLGTLHPHKEYKLYVNYKDNKEQSTGFILMVTLTVEDRTSYQMQLFLVLFAIFMTFLVGFLARSCEIPTL